MKAMNVIGIDHQLSVTTIALREARTTVAGTRVIGDGWYPIIHNLVSPDPAEKGKYLLGTAALSLGSSAADLSYEQPGTVEAFWSATARILSDYLGRTMPVEANGYRVVMTPGAGVDLSMALSAMRCAGLSTLEVITPGEALLARRLASALPAEDLSRIVVVAAGDCATTVQSFEIEAQSGIEPRIIQQSEKAEIHGHGDRVWREHLLNLLLEKHIESPAVPLNRNARVLASVRRLASQLCGQTKPLSWDGGQKKLFAPVIVTANSSMWPRLRSFELEVRAAIAEVSRMMPGGRPQELFIGGVGADWPFLRDIASSAGSVRMNPRPSEDLAIGCCWAEILCRYAADSERLLEAASPSAISSSTQTVLPAASASGDLPPWERRSFDLDLTEELD